MAKADTVERLIRQGRDGLTPDVQETLLYQLKGELEVLEPK